jgi:hypothetical protein
VIFQELHTADDAVIFEKHQRRDESEAKPCGRKLLNRFALVLFEQGQDDDGANGGKPRHNRKDVQIIHIAWLPVLGVNAGKPQFTR